MLTKDPGLWAAALAWLVAYQPQLYTGGTYASGKTVVEDGLQHRKLTTFCRKTTAEPTIQAISGR